MRGEISRLAWGLGQIYTSFTKFRAFTHISLTSVTLIVRKTKRVHLEPIPMKTTFLIFAAVTGLAILLSPARAEEPAPPAVSPEVQALLGELSKMAAGANAKESPQIDLPALLGMLLKMVPAAAAKGGDVPVPAGDAPKAAPGAAAKDMQVQELQAQLVELVKALSKMAADDAPAPVPDPAPAPGSASAANPRPSALTTGNLNGASLAPSSALNGRGTTGGIPKMTDAEWRLLFPTRDDRK